MRTSFTLIKKVSVMFLIVAFISGCASGSKSIKASYVSPLQYQSYDCNQIGQEMSRVGRNVSEVAAQQDNVAGKDAAMMGVGLVLFWPALFALAAGEDRKEELARLKGEADALEQCAINKQCTQVLAQIATDRKLLEENQLDKDLVEKRMNECRNMLGGVSNCFRENIEKELQAEQEVRTLSQTVKQQEVPQKESLSTQNLVDIKMQECLDVMNPVDCRIEDMEEKVKTDLENKMKAEAASSTANQTQLSYNDQLKDKTVQPAPIIQSQNQSSNAEIYRTKCAKCGDVVTYQAKYSGTATTCMQCDNHFTLP